MHAVGRLFEAGFAKLLRGYERSLAFALRHSFLMLMITFASLAASILAFMFMPKGFFPLEDTGFVFAQTEAAQDISYEGMLEKQRQVAALVQKDEAVESVFFALGGGRGALNSGRIFFGLKPKAERDSAQAVINRLRGKVAAIPGIKVFMQPVQNIQVGGRLSKSLYQYTLQGSDLQELYQWAAKLEAELIKEQGFRDVTTDLQLKSLEARVVVDADRAASFGLDYAAVRQLLYQAFGNAQAATLYTPSNDYQVILETPTAAQRSPESIKNLYATSPHRAGCAAGSIRPY